jgi:hypothetical protein
MIESLAQALRAIALFLWLLIPAQLAFWLVVSLPPLSANRDLVGLLLASAAIVTAAWTIRKAEERKIDALRADIERTREIADQARRAAIAIQNVPKIERLNQLDKAASQLYRATADVGPSLRTSTITRDTEFVVQAQEGPLAAGQHLGIDLEGVQAISAARADMLKAVATFAASRSTRDPVAVDLEQIALDLIEELRAVFRDVATALGRGFALSEIERLPRTEIADRARKET